MFEFGYLSKYDEPTRIRGLGKMAMSGITVGFIVSAELADKYCRLIAEQFPELEVAEKLVDFPEAGVALVKIRKSTPMGKLSIDEALSVLAQYATSFLDEHVPGFIEDGGIVMAARQGTNFAVVGTGGEDEVQYILERAVARVTTTPADRIDTPTKH